ncbi:MAG: hypothetical protein ACM3Q1_11215 [Bacteroidales bacterium]
MRADIRFMELEETPLLHFPDLALAVLRAGHHAPATVADALVLVERTRRQAHESAPVDTAELAEHLNGARRHLAAASAIEMLDGERFRTTPRGLALLRVHPDGVDDGVLMDYPEFRLWLRTAERSGHPEDPRPREFTDGWIARKRGGALEDNPFPGDTAQHQAWGEGWRESDRHEWE